MVKKSLVGFALSALLFSTTTLAQSAKVDLDPYESYFQCYKRLSSIPEYNEVSTNREDVEREDPYGENPIPVTDPDKNGDTAREKQVYLFGANRVLRYDLKNSKDYDDGIRFEKRRLVFDDKHSYSCPNLMFSKKGGNNLGFCSNQDAARGKNFPALTDEHGADVMGETTTAILRKLLVTTLHEVESRFKETSLLHDPTAGVHKMYREDLSTCRSSFRQDKELYKTIDGLAQRILNAGQSNAGDTGNGDSQIKGSSGNAPH